MGTANIFQEHHLQAVISAGHSGTKDILIPTPNTSEIPLAGFQKLYPKKFTQPTSYIRFSSTVEDCNGTAYCMSSADDDYVVKLNSVARKPLESISEDDFESVMDLYESTIQLRQPFLSVDVTSLLSYEEMKSAFEEGLEPSLKNIAKLLYPHWKEQKVARGGRAIIPVLKVTSISLYRCSLLKVISLNKEMRKMMETHMFVSGDEKCVKCVELVEQMPKAAIN